MSRLSSGVESRSEQDQRYWEGVMASRREAVKAAVEQVDLFFSPSLYLRDRFVGQGGFSKQRMTYLSYGFDKARLASVERVPGEPFTFGFLGRHVPAKGLDYLIAAFRQIQGTAQLRIWGRPEVHVDASLRALAEGDARIHFQGEYANEHIVAQLDKIDALVVPSRWMENSPLVIHEAQQARIPVITADVGGMAELVKNGINGLTFEHRSVDSLAAALQRSVDEQEELARLGKRGYLLSSDGDVPGIQEHLSTLIGQYDKLLSAKRAPKTAPASLFRRPGPVRVTFDTNPDSAHPWSPLTAHSCTHTAPFQRATSAAPCVKASLSTAACRLSARPQARHVGSWTRGESRWLCATSFRTACGRSSRPRWASRSCTGISAFSCASAPNSRRA